MGVFGIGGLFCSMIGSAFGQSLYNTSRATLPVFVATCTAAGAVPLILLVLFGWLGWFLVVVLAALGGVAAATGPNLKGMLMNANPPNTRSSVFSLFNLIDNIGKGLGPSVLVLLTWICGGNRSFAFAFAFSFWFLSAWLQLKLSECFVSDVVNLEVKTDHEPTREPFDLFHIYHSGERNANS
jgi:MFS family permease